MLKYGKGRLIYSLGSLGLAVVAVGLSACNQSVEPNSRGDQTGVPAQSEKAAPNQDNATVVEGYMLQGEELAAFLKMRGTQSQAQTSPKMSIASKPAAKTASYSACVVDFDSPKGLAHMDDRAYQFYATSPYYIQPCSPFYASVTPSIGNHYYLIPEAAGTCPGSYGQMGYGPDFSNCTNQQDAANFIRYASKASPNDGNMAIVVTLPQDGVNNIFTANSYYGKDGTISVYGRRSNGSWIHWAPASFTGSWGRIILGGGTNLSELDFYAGTSTGTFSVDNISVTPQ